MELAPFYRRYELPWEGDEDNSRRFKRILAVALGIYVLGALVIPVCAQGIIPVSGDGPTPWLCARSAVAREWSVDRPLSSVVVVISRRHLPSGARSGG